MRKQARRQQYHLDIKNVQSRIKMKLSIRILVVLGKIVSDIVQLFASIFFQLLGSSKYLIKVIPTIF